MVLLLSRIAATALDGSQYFVLLIITDGEITDFEETKEAIVNVSSGGDLSEFEAFDWFACLLGVQSAYVDHHRRSGQRRFRSDGRSGCRSTASQLRRKIRPKRHRPGHCLLTHCLILTSHD